MKTLIQYTLVCLLMLGAGCAHYRPEVRSLDEQVDFSPAAVEGYRSDREWWLAYGDPQLDRIVNMALENNIDFAKTAVSVNRALYRANLLGADLLPSFSADGQGQASRSIKTGDPSARTFSGDLSVSYEIDLWRRLADSASAGAWEFEATVEDREAARLALINNVVDAYFHLVYLHNAIEVTSLTVEHYTKIKELTQTRYDYGKVDAVEPAQAAQSLLSAQSTLIDLQTEFKTTEQALYDFLNLRPETPLQLDFPSLLEMKMPEIDLEVPVAVLAARPDLRASEMRLKSAFKDLRAAEKSWYPTVSVGSTLSSSSDKAKTVFDFPFASGFIKINLPFLQWNTVKWNVKISEADYEEALLSFEQSITGALNEVDSYYFQFLKAKESQANADEKYAYDIKISEYYKNRYDMGADPLSDWLAALNTEAASKRSLLSSRYTVLRTENLLYKALAGRYVRE